MKTLTLLLALLMSPASLLAQGVFVPPQTAFKNINGILMPIANATITVCAANAGGIPCAPALINTIFKDSGLSQPLSNPFTADANGNYQFAATAATYTVTVTAAGFAGYSYQASLGGSGGGGGNVPLGSAAQVPVMNPAATAYAPQSKPVIDVRDGIGGLAGAACDGITDDTAAAQRAVNAAITFSTTPKTLIFPAGCAIKLTSTLSIAHCGGLTFDGGQSQGQTSLSGAPGGPATFLWYGAAGQPVITINQCRDSTFKRFSVFTNASAPGSNGASNGILIDEIAPVTGIVTNNKFEDIQVYNGNSNSSFIGINICPTAPGNCEAQNFYRLFETCANAAPTSSNNGIGIRYGAAGGSSEPFYSYINWFEPAHCSRALDLETNNIFTLDGGLFDLNYTDVYLNAGQNVTLKNYRSESGTAQIVMGTLGGAQGVFNLELDHLSFSGLTNNTTTIGYANANTGGILKFTQLNWDANATVTPFGPIGGGGFTGTIDSQGSAYPNATLCPGFNPAANAFHGINDFPGNGPCPYGGVQLTGSNAHVYTGGMLNTVSVASGTAALGTSAIASGTCAAAVTVPANGVSLASGFTPNNAGTGYAVGDVVQLAVGGTAGGNVKVAQVSGGGVITQIVVLNVVPGTAGTNLATIAISGVGTGATLDTVGDNISWNFTGDPTAITGYAPAAGGALRIVSYPTANNVNFKVCNDTSGSITPGAAKLNWRVPR